MAQYMVIYVEVDSGEIKEVYESDKVGEIGEKAGPVEKGKWLMEQTEATAITTLYAHLSPGCRMVPFGGGWRMVCTAN